jgi:hypothetical protein
MQLPGNALSPSALLFALTEAALRAYWQDPAVVPVKQAFTREMKPLIGALATRALSATTIAIDTTAMMSAYSTTCDPSSSQANVVTMPFIALMSSILNSFKDVKKECLID